VNIASIGVVAGVNVLDQLAEKNNVLTTVTISGSEQFNLGSSGAPSNREGVVTDIAATAAFPTKIHSSLTLIEASATTGDLQIYAGATNTSGAGQFANGRSLDPNVTITYTGLTIKGGSGHDTIGNDAKNGVVTAGNGNGDWPQSVQAISAAEGRITDGAAENRGRNLRPSFRRAPCSLKRVIGDFAVQDLFVSLLDCLLIHDTDPSFRHVAVFGLRYPHPHATLRSLR
jgi:hypothetical protein